MTKPPAKAFQEAQSSQGDSTESQLLTRGLFMHAWDLHDHGADQVMGWMRDSRLKQMYIASCYHSGWFVHSHNSKHRSYMTEGGVAYFHPDEKLYRQTPIRPQVASFARNTNWLAVAGERLEKYGLQMVSWTIGAHNTKLGLLYPQFTQQNVYGDSIPHALSIGHDATRDYLKALCRDLALNYPMHAVQLESFEWMTWGHGHHHERDLTGLTPLEQDLLAMCFNPQTVAKAEAAGIDAGKAREVVEGTLDAAFRESPNRPKGHPRSMAELEAKSTALKGYNRFRAELVNSLIVEIKQQSFQGTTCRLFLQSEYQREVAQAVDGFATWAYGEPPEKVLATVKRAKKAIPSEWVGEFPCFIRLGMGIPSSEEQLREIVLALKRGGSTGPIFYNYSESPVKMLGWIKNALTGL